MAWVPLTSLGPVDFYVQYKAGFAEALIVPIDELDPEIGTVTVVDGVVVCDFVSFNNGGSPGGCPLVIAVPQGAIGSGPMDVRLTASNISLSGNYSVNASFMSGQWVEDSFDQNESVSMDPTGNPVTVYEVNPAMLEAVDLSGPPFALAFMHENLGA